jgi:hypothetical protein
MADIVIKKGNGEIHIDAKEGVSLSGSTLDWYKLTEASRHVISQSISGSIQQQIQELEKADPDQDKIQKLQALAHTLSALNRDPKVFKSKERMLQIIEQYGQYQFND